MKSKSIITGLGTALALVCANLSLAATSFPDDLASFSCEIKPLTQDGLQTALANRERFAKACLACIEDNCASVSGQPDTRIKRRSAGTPTVCPKKCAK